MRYWTAWLLLVTLSPLLIFQALRLRRTVLRLPPAGGPRQGEVPGTPDALTLLTMGESTVAGVGASNHREALGGQIATVLNRLSGRSIQWEAVGLNGMIARDTGRQLMAWVERRPVDVIVVALGVNDALALRSPQRWVTDLDHLIAHLKKALQPQMIVLTAVPPVGQFPAIPRPLRTVFGLVARSLDRATRYAVQQWPKTCYAALPENMQHDARHFSHDGFHPSPSGYALWSELVADTIVERLKIPGTKATSG